MVVEDGSASRWVGLNANIYHIGGKCWTRECN